MEFNQLESFLSVVKHKSFSKAAKELYLTQPTISNNIQNLENQLSTTLLDRKSKTITLTDSGNLLYKYAVDLINIRDQAKFNIMEQKDKIEGLIQINASSIPEQYILPYIIKDFQKLYPNVSFSVTNKDSSQVIDHILHGTEHFGIVGAKHISKKLEYVAFFEDELVLAVPNNEQYPMDSYTSVNQDFLFTEKYIFRKEGSGTRSLAEKTLAEIGISLDDLNIVSLIDSNEAIKKMVELKLGVSFASNISIKNEIALGLIKALKVEGLNLKRKFYFVYNKNVTLSPVIEVFKDFLIHWPGIQF